MANKFKLFVGFLALIALFSIYSFFNSFSASSPTAKTANILQNSISFKLDSDVDKDGLTNRDESYWNTDFQNPDSDGDGFLDGEEVSSGHDPLIPSPNDILNNGNLTDKLSSLTLSGLYEGSLKPSDPSYNKSLNDMALAVMDDATKSLSPEIDFNKLKVISSNKKNQEVYIEEISSHFENFLKTYGEEMQSLQKYLELINQKGFGNKDVISYFQAKEQRFQDMFNGVYSLTVPKNWTQAHINFLRLIKTLQVSNNSIAHGSEDPVKASAGLNALGETLENFSETISLFIDKIKSENLNNSFFKSLTQ